MYWNNIPQPFVKGFQLLCHHSGPSKWMRLALVLGGPTNLQCLGGSCSCLWMSSQQVGRGWKQRQNTLVFWCKTEWDLHSPNSNTCRVLQTQVLLQPCDRWLLMDASAEVHLWGQLWVSAQQLSWKAWSTFGRPGSQNRERFVQIKYLKIVRSIST